MAAAFFNAAAPYGWTATSAGITPQSAVSERLVPLMSGMGADDFIDEEPPRGLSDTTVARTIAIDAEVPGAEVWQTDVDGAVTDELVRDRIRTRVSRLVAELAGTPAL